MAYVFNPFTGNFDYYQSGGSVAGSNTQIQYNNSGAFGASSNFTWNNDLNINGTTGSTGNLRLLGGSSGTGDFGIYWTALNGQGLRSHNGFLQWSDMIYNTWYKMTTIIPFTSTTSYSTGGILFTKDNVLAEYDNPYFYYDGINKQFSVGTNSPLATSHFKPTGFTVGQVTGEASVTQLESLASAPSGDTVTLAAPLTVGSYNGTASESVGGGYTYQDNGNTYEIRYVNYFTTGGTTYYSPVFTSGSFADGYAVAVAATGSVTITGVPADNETVAIGDGVNTVTFTFGNGYVSTNQVDTSSGDINTITSNLQTSLNASSPTLTISGTVSTNTFSFTNTTPGAAGNVAITTSDPGDISVTGMSGGSDIVQNNFAISGTYTATPTGGGYTGTLLGRQINGGGYLWYDAGASGASGTIFDDGSGSPYNWGSASAPGTTSPDFVANNTTYNFDVYANATSPSGHLYYILGDSPTYTDANDGFPFHLSLNNGNAFQVKFHETSATFDKIVNAGVSSIVATNTVTDSHTITPTSYGYTPDGTGTSPNYYQIFAYRTIGGHTFYGAPSAWTTVNYADASSPWYSQVTWGAVTSATGYIVHYGTNGTDHTKYINVGNVTTLGDDALTVWSTGDDEVLTPNTYLPPTSYMEGAYTNTGISTIAEVKKLTGSGTKWLTSYQNSSGTQVATHQVTFDGQQNFTSTSNMVFLSGGTFNFDYAGGSLNGGNLAGGLNLSTTTDINLNAATDINFKMSSVSKMYLTTNTFSLFEASVMMPYASTSSNYSMGFGSYVLNVTGNSPTIILPNATTFVNGNSRGIAIIKNSGTGTVTIATSPNTQTIDGVTTKTLTQYQSITVQSNGSNWIVLEDSNSFIDYLLYEDEIISYEDNLVFV